MALSKREILKNLVKVKLDEISPFDNKSGDSSVESFIAADGDPDYNEVNPIGSYIEKSLDSATSFCLNDLPFSVLSDDVDSDYYDIDVNHEGVGFITDWFPYRRLSRVRVERIWGRDVVSFLSPRDQGYALQQNRWTRSGRMKPSVAYVPETQCLELYSFPRHMRDADAEVFYIDTSKKAEQVSSEISDYIALRCAAYVLEILGDADKAGVLMTEYENKKKGLMQ